MKRLAGKFATWYIPVVILVILSEVVFTGINWNTAILAGITLVILAAAAVVCWRQIISPIKHLAVVMKEYRHNLPDNLPIAPFGDEIGDLWYEFSRLYREITRLRNDLEETRQLTEKRIIKRTQSLSRNLHQLKQTVRQDGLTGLANRRHFQEYSRVLFDYTRRNRLELSCLMIDVDNFKAVNDTFGHQFGDEIICLAANIIKTVTRKGDICARYGGDEFILLLQQCPIEYARQVAERLRLHFAREVTNYVKRSYEYIGRCDGKPVKIPLPHFSIGIATRIVHEAKLSNDLIQMADEALYRAKSAGRNCVMTY